MSERERVIMNDLPPIDSDDFLPAVRAKLDRALLGAVQAINDEHEAWLLDHLLRGAPDDVRRRVLGAD